jgi:hypothetical protein
VFPGVLIFGLGLSFVVGRLTATALSAVSDERAGVASPVNSMVAPVAGLVPVAALPVAVGIAWPVASCGGSSFAMPTVRRGTLSLTTTAWSTALL